MSGMLLLLVDDEEQFLSTTKILLERRGINTLACTNGIDALELLKKTPIDVIVLDIKMPGINGLEVLSKIKQEHPGVEVVLLSGHASQETADKGLELGAFDFLSKPSRISEIMTKVEEAYQRKQGSKSQRQPAQDHP
jgi:DNA-binding NtrC family response regulator